MSLTEGKLFKMTKKTKIYLWLYHFFDRIGKIGQYFINHCDVEEEGWYSIMKKGTKKEDDKNER